MSRNWLCKAKGCMFEFEPNSGKYICARCGANPGSNQIRDAFQPVSGNVSGKAGVGPRIPNAGCGKDGGL
jgi:hypothetical protein